MNLTNQTAAFIGKGQLLLAATLLMLCGVQAQSLVEPGTYTAELVGTLPTGSTAHFGGITSDEAENLYLTTGASGQVYRLPKGGSFELLATLPGTESRGIAVDGDTLYVAGSGRNIYSLDLTQPTPQPVLVTTLPGGAIPASLLSGCPGYGLLVGTTDGIYDIDVLTGATDQLQAVRQSMYPALACLQTGELIAARFDGLHLEKMEADNMVNFGGYTADGPDAIAVHPSTGQVVIASGAENMLQIMEADGTSIRLFASGIAFGFGFDSTALGFTADGSSLYYAVNSVGGPEVHVINGFPKVSAKILEPLSGSSNNGDIAVVFDAAAGIGNVTTTLEFSADGGLTYQMCTPAAASHAQNPETLSSPALSTQFVWNSYADGVALWAPEPAILLRALVSNGIDLIARTIVIEVTNLTVATISSPGADVQKGGDVVVTFDAHDSDYDPLEAEYRYSLDAGKSWRDCTAAVSSPIASNPSAPLPTPILAGQFIWNSFVDDVGLLSPQPAILRMQVVDDDPRTSTTAVELIINNLPLICAQCGDCNLDGAGPGILDALMAAQIGVGIIGGGGDLTCCDIDSSGGITILDALAIAQVASGLSMTLQCP